MEEKTSYSTILKILNIFFVVAYFSFLILAISIIKSKTEGKTLLIIVLGISLIFLICCQIVLNKIVDDIIDLQKTNTQKSASAIKMHHAILKLEESSSAMQKQIDELKQRTEV